MRLLKILLALAGLSAGALAQPNTQSITNQYGADRTETRAGVPAPVRRLSLQECIQMALQHNLDLQIDRYNPQISLYALRADYGDYDPTLNLSGQHDHNESGSQLLSGGFSIAGSVSDDNSFGSSLSGLLPWGTTYNVGTGRAITDTYGTTPNFVNDPTQPFVRSNTVFGAIPGAGAVGYLLTTNFAQVPVREPFENSAGSVSISVTQPLLKNFWINQTQLNIRVAKNRLKYTEQLLRLQMMQTISQLEQAYYDLIYYRENVVVQEKAVELAAQLVVENRKRVEVGSLAPLDLQSAEAQAASTRAAVIQAKSQLGTQERLVKQLITDRFTDWANIELVPTGSLSSLPPMVNLRDSWNRALEERPELRQAKLDIERQGIQLKFDRNQLFPQLDVFGTYGFNGSGREFAPALDDIQMGDRPFYTYGGRFSMPVSNTRARNSYRADKASMQQLVLTLKRLEQAIMIAVDNDIGTLRANYDQVRATRTAREYEEAALDAEQKKLESGKSTTYTVLQVQRDLTTARGNEIQAQDTYNKSLSQLSLDEASTLDRLRVNLEVK